MPTLAAPSKTGHSHRIDAAIFAGIILLIAGGLWYLHASEATRRAAILQKYDQVRLPASMKLINQDYSGTAFENAATWNLTYFTTATRHDVFDGLRAAFRAQGYKETLVNPETTLYETGAAGQVVIHIEPDPVPDYPANPQLVSTIKVRIDEQGHY